MVSMIYEYLFVFVCCFSMFDYLSNGWIGWNIVMFYLMSVVCNFGFDWMIGYDECYVCVEEFFDVVYKFWEGSWVDDVVVVDKYVLCYVCGECVWLIVYEGMYYCV